MESAELRRRIIDALHDSGQLPMHLEYALQVGEKVFPAMGASFNALGQKRVSGQIVRIPGPNCAAKNIDMSGRIVVVNRGGCDFVTKAKIVSEGGGLALVVVDVTQDNAKKAAVYMDGDASLPITSVIVSKSAGEAIDALLLADPDEKRTKSNVVFGSSQCTILGGALAVQGRHCDLHAFCFFACISTIF